MNFWLVRKEFVLVIVAAHSAEEAIETVVEDRNEKIWLGCMEEEDKANERRDFKVYKVIMPSSPAVIAEYRE